MAVFDQAEDKRYYSQYGQDEWLNSNIFHNKRGGIFVDIGAHDGLKYSNTLFYERELGWSGICVEPIPEVYSQLIQNRTSICIKGCAYHSETQVIFNRIDGSSEMLSGIFSEYCQEHLNRINREIEENGGRRKTIQVNAFSLSSLLRNHGITTVDYLSIDTEGSEYAVLQGLDFDKVLVDVIDVEENYSHEGDRIRALLEEKGFVFLQKVGIDMIFRNKVLMHL